MRDRKGKRGRIRKNMVMMVRHEEKGRQGKANLRGGVAFAVCARNILPAPTPSSPSTSTPMLKETEAAAASHVPQKKRSFLLPLVAAVLLLPPCSSDSPDSSSPPSPSPSSYSSTPACTSKNLEPQNLSLTSQISNA